MHDVVNETERHALSLHVSSPALTSITFYDVDGERLVVRGVGWADDGCGEAGVELPVDPVEVEAASR